MSISMNPAIGNQGAASARPLLISRLQVDSLCKDYELTEDQSECLYNMSFLASNSGGPGEITVPQLAIQLMATAVTFSCWNRRFEEDQETEDMHRLMKKMELRLDENSNLSRDQNRLLQLAGGTLVYNPARTSYCNLGEDLYAHVEANNATLGLAEFFDTPARARSLANSCDSMARSVRNALKLVLVNSLLHNKSLDQVTAELNKTYAGGNVGYNEYAVRFRNALLRRVLIENPVLFLGFVPGETLAESRKRARATGARLLHKHDYWAVVDRWYEEKLKSWGTDMTQGEWKQFIDETLRKENEGYADALAIGIMLVKKPAPPPGSIAGPSNGLGSFIDAMTGGASV
ncbi:hypothetical protein V5O48_013312 [Marasmius crinis-equi]|uniref:Uncharacterized protein n=1 Tax=Marasmius crinis-equi TaxID=585013 RepID=A0ABR3F0U8_9AGAR